MSDNSKLDYEPLGCICAPKGSSAVIYIFAALLIVAGIIVYFAVMPSLAVFAIFAFFAFLSVWAGVATEKSVWYWGEEKFTISRFLEKPHIFYYHEIAQAFAVNECGIVTVVIRMKNGKEYGLSPRLNGSREFLEFLDSKLYNKNAETANV